MSTNPRRRGANVRPGEGPARRTTAEATPDAAGMIRDMNPGYALEQQIGRAFTRQGQPFDPAGVSTSWSGAERLVQRLTALGCSLDLQVHEHHCRCCILHVLKGNALAKQLASMEAATLPEAVAKAALLTLMAMQPPSA
jgi:hypothetical protein